ncbi:hypothetical protein A2962_00850 [Candidatus Woesebacteria bacterium RIFCSPLOWO2_01_FULL_39_61]|uniref:Uncharacterized protein n=1 Tax=Candidatus Woesebacteria bacterium RIFCSPHIGHO2_02_FULL_39_13 TaxID=1802505 RepID=A0A1F7YX36_9BACT|nr:MAG: hypothetical protein A2692_03655 [Candidatus Woesebacteria bacterium RIFCSPHIGHO2_01_FULL_39_95]OGM31790.1 MAG: hypothetical protein A3D01_05465 [Candidatus Woesebacteria bacterium RIFCSPHIGHO2_02_FULL_39_13]OGM36464.1 MAG: hypothetical protein A3E13_02345 [Candidatus Woesebacteria bacterium RIFCSPHIGHO2_12_FULL_40_20]OGM68755.1 MAG: hypothetical protein A2962_00850 [Candidatus Woesebacteria bacterium RIFCSPLOWO2_01_FULL_39_61]OGM75101.1 MAG: hypothetical protein A3H19_01840 [Candidatus
MQLVSRKNFLIFLAALLVVALGYMIISSSGRYLPQGSDVDPEIQKVETQSSSDDIDSIEKDINNTDYSGIDKDLQDVQNELNQSY